MRNDVTRASTVAASAVVAVIGAAVGSGFLIGTPIPQVAGGALAADATLIAPGGPAFSIWSVIYLGLMIQAAYQLTRAQRVDPRQRRVGWWVAASLLLNAAWILTVQAGSVVGSLVVIGLLLLVLLTTFALLVGSTPSSRLQAVLLDGTMGLYLGWVAIATAANGAAALTSAAGWSATGLVATLWALLLLFVAAATGLTLAVAGRGRVAPALSLAWGLGWIVAARSTGEPRSVVIAAAAAIAAVAVLAAPILVRLRGGVSRASAR